MQVWLGLPVWLGLLTGWGVQFTARAQPVPQNEPIPADHHGAFLPTDRGATRRLEQAQELLQQERYTEAVRFLGSILESDEDLFFNPDESKSNFRSLKSEATRILGELPARGRETYELQFGARAENLLNESLSAADVAGLANVSRQYLHTPAGYQATLLVGMHHLDHVRPLAAALSFQQLLDAPQAAAKFGPALSVMAAHAWNQAGMPERAVDVLSELKERNPQAKFELAGTNVELFADGADPLAWLASTVDGRRSLLPDVAKDEWTLFRGNASRSAASQGGRPLLTPRWRVRTANHPTIEGVVSQMRQAYRSQDIAALPGLHPLAVGDVVLMRTARSLLAVDFQTGRRVWEVRPNPGDSFDELVAAARSRATSGVASQLAMGLEQRMWDDAAYGTFSSDGERVYAIQDLDIVSSNPYNPGVIFLRAQGGLVPTQPKPYNRLTAVEIETQGKLLWEAGGPDGGVPELEEAFFLGPPLPLSGQLYVLAEIRNGIRLVVLDAKSGELDWSQQLVDLERSHWQDPQRRLAGASPSFANGILVCPITAGVVVAVDLTKRSLLWAYKYPRKYEDANGQGFLVPGARIHRRQVGMKSDESWVDATATLVDGRVLLTPPDSDEMHCLSLLDGSVLWTAERGENLYLACAHQGNVVLVGREGLTALRLADGSPAWDPAASPFPDQSLPSGRGYYSGDSYFVPLSSAEVARFDLQDGRLVDRAESRDGSIPGNLICYRGEVISQGVDFLETFYQIEPLRNNIAQALSKDPDDADALARRGQLALEEERLDDAIRDFRRSYQLNPEDLLTRELLVSSLFDALRSDFADNREAADQLEDLIDQPSEQLELLRLTAGGLHDAGDVIPAFEAYARLAELNQGNGGLEKIDADRSIRLHRLIQSQLTVLRDAATDSQREQMDAAVAARAGALPEDASAMQLRRFVQHFGDFPAANPVRLQVARRLLDADMYLEAEMLLRQAATSSNRQEEGRAVALMAEMLRKAGRPQQAAAYYARMAGELADVQCRDDMTGSQIVAALAQTDPVRLMLDGRPRWPMGKVRVSPPHPNNDNGLARRRSHAISLAGPGEPAFEATTVALDQQSQPFTISGFDGQGRELFQAALITDNNDPRRMYLPGQHLYYGKTCGHLLVVSLGYQLLAVDTLRDRSAVGDSMLWQQDLIEQIPGIQNARSVQPMPMMVPGGLRRYRATDADDRPVGTLGPVTEQGFIFQRFNELVCIDPVSGEEIWVRHDVPPGVDLFGDDEYLFVVPQDATEAQVYRPLDGKLLGIRPVPSAEERVSHVGGHVLRLRNEGVNSSIGLVDVWNQRELWEKQFPRSAKTWLNDGDSLAVMQTDGRFQLVELDSGELAIDELLEPEPELSNIYMINTPEQYFLVVDHGHRRVERQQGINIQPVPGGVQENPLVSGRIYAFGRESGAPQWDTPVTVQVRGVLLTQPADLPVLAFVQQVTQPPRGGRQRTTTSVLCIDKRTGERLFEKSDFPFTSTTYSLQGRAEDRVVTLSLPNQSVTMEFTDEPVPPEPPMQADLAEADTSGNSLVNILFKALPRAGRQSEQQSDEP
ncbi:MAG: PQQ-binding-like beta-propeller repeat protein [Pirellulales bacterium]